MKRKHGGDIYSHPGVLDFSANINPYETPASVREAAISGLNYMYAYPDPENRKLKHALAEHYGFPEKFWICGSGAADLIYTLLYTIRPEKVLIPVPCFTEYEDAVKASGGETVPYMLREKDAFRLPDSFPEALHDGIDLLILNQPANPTGQTISRGLMEEILRQCRKHGIFLLADECFLEFAEGGVCSLEEHIADNPSLFILHSFTKMFGMAGLRAGYGICSDPGLLGAMERHRQPWTLSTPAEAAAAAALAETEFAQRSGMLLQKEREKMEASLSVLTDRVFPSHANYILFRAEAGLKEKMLRKRILIRDCSGYTGLSEGFYRTAVRKPEENRLFLEALREIRSQEIG